MFIYSVLSWRVQNKLKKHLIFLPDSAIIYWIYKYQEKDESIDDVDDDDVMMMIFSGCPGLSIAVVALCSWYGSL